MQPAQSRLKAAILSAAKAGGFQAPLFESTQLTSKKTHKKGRGLASLSHTQHVKELEYPQNSASFPNAYPSSYATTNHSSASTAYNSFSERPSTSINTNSPQVSFSNPEALTDQLTACLKDDLNKSELRTFKLLHTVALEVAAARRYSPNVTHVSFFCPLEIIALALELSRTTIWRHLKIMKELGIVSHRPHKTTYRSKTLNDGSLWNIKLNPTKGKAARLSFEELKTQYRNLSLDISNQRTAYALKQERIKQNQQTSEATKQEQKQEATTPSKAYEYSEEFPLLNKMKQSYKTTEDYKGKILVLTWTLKPILSLSPVSTDCFIADSKHENQASFYLESILDIKFTSRNDRNRAVQTAASSIAITLNDYKSHKFYCDLLWNLLRRYDRGEDDFLTVFEMILRAKVDQLEGFARSAGALFVSRLKKWKVYEEIKRTPAVRVGVKPALVA